MVAMNNAKDSHGSPTSIFAFAARSLHARRKAPPPIPIPVDAISTVKQAVTSVEVPEKTFSATVELSDYPPHLTCKEVKILFEGYQIAEDFKLPRVTHFSRPLRAFIPIASDHEAERAERDLDGTIIGERFVRVCTVEKISDEEKKKAEEELALELKIQIIIPDTAQAYYPHLSEKILEVREYQHGTSRFAFLQARDPITFRARLEQRTEAGEEKVDWKLIAAGRSEGTETEVDWTSQRLAALNDLQLLLQTQGKLGLIWSRLSLSSDLTHMAANQM